jgi:hypothetical protein
MSTDFAKQILIRECDALRAEAAAIMDKVSGLEAAIRRLDGAGHKAVPPLESLKPPDTPSKRAPDTGRRKGQAEMILDVLKESQDIWMDQAAIAAALEGKGTPIKPSSLQPVLSLLRRDNRVARNGISLVAHLDRVPKAAE